MGLSGGAVSVGDGTGFFGMLAPSAGPFASLPEVASDDLDLQLVVTSGKIGDGGGLYLTVQTRRIDKTRSYTGRIAVRADGTVDGAIARENGTDPTFLGRASDLFVLTAGAPARMRVQATGTRPTRLRLKSWLASEPEPSAWAIDVMDSEPAWQAKGTVGLTAFLSSTATNAPFDVRIDDLLVRPASRLP